MYGLLTKCEVKRAGYWPSSFFASLWTSTSSRSINSQKRTRPISSHLDRTNLVNKGFIIWLLVKFCLRDTAGSPERARWLHLARSGSQSQRAIWFILPAHGACHIIRNDNTDCGLRTTDYRLGIKHGLRYKTWTKHYGLGIEYGPGYKMRTEHYGLGIKHERTVLH